MPIAKPDGHAAADGQPVPVTVGIAITEQRPHGRRFGQRLQGNRVDRPSRSCRAGLGLQPGQPFFPTQLAIDRDAIELRYANEGFRNATVASSPD